MAFVINLSLFCSSEQILQIEQELTKLIAMVSVAQFFFDSV